MAAPAPFVGQKMVQNGPVSILCKIFAPFKNRPAGDERLETSALSGLLQFFCSSLRSISVPSWGGGLFDSSFHLFCEGTLNQAIFSSLSRVSMCKGCCFPYIGSTKDTQFT